MHRRGDRANRKRGSVEIIEDESSGKLEHGSSIESFESVEYIKSTSTPLNKAHSGSEDVGGSLRNVFQDPSGSEEDSSVAKRRRRAPRSEEKRSGSSRDRGESLERRRKKRSRKRDKRRNVRELDDDSRQEASASISSDKHETHKRVAKRSRKKKDSYDEEGEVPITKILERVQENIRTKYEEPVPMSVLTTDKIYLQGRNGFSAIKIGSNKGRGEGKADRGSEALNNLQNRSHSPIRVAIVAQRLWKSTGLVYQGLLGGMSFMHFIMMHVFFNASLEFISDYSIFAEIYTNVFSFLLVMCVLSVFDKFDLARLSMSHLQEILTDHGKTVIVIPLYLVIFCLHQASSKNDDELALLHYQASNKSFWSNESYAQDFLNDVKSWEIITLSKDFLAVLTWIFISVGPTDDMLLLHLESMESKEVADDG
ncbi:hypothetical protein KM043_005724 [Ampulex compressa]|nr:hypothetical protein KM043_005724 [Ampulex compressa]